MCNMEFTPDIKIKKELRPYQLFCDKVCFVAWMDEIEREEKVFHRHNTQKEEVSDTI